MDSELAKDLDLKRVQNHVDELAGKFDSVQVFVSRFDPTTGCTTSLSVGSGNWHARKGQVLEWVTKHDEIERCTAMDSLMEDEDEE